MCMGSTEWILKVGCYDLCKPLSMLYKSCGKLPSDWKEVATSYTDILKMGLSMTNSYHPVSPTSQICKILESFV